MAEQFIFYTKLVWFPKTLPKRVVTLRDHNANQALSDDYHDDDDDRQIQGVLQRGSSESGLLLGGSLHNLLIFDSMVMMMIFINEKDEI